MSDIQKALVHHKTVSINDTFDCRDIDEILTIVNDWKKEGIVKVEVGTYGHDEGYTNLDLYRLETDKELDKRIQYAKKLEEKRLKSEKELKEKKLENERKTYERLKKKFEK